MNILYFASKFTNPTLCLTNQTLVSMAEEKDGERNRGKGRCVCLGGKIYRFPSRASYFASVDLEE